MDMVFHAASAALLARGLGETRRPILVLAGLAGCVPDIVWYALRVAAPGKVDAYAAGHSVRLALAVGLVAAVVSWRIAFGGLLHILFDQLTHADSGLYRLIPPPGCDWWRGPGIILWAALWLGLIGLAGFCLLRARRRSRQAG
jgi:hypothetical protein